MLMESAGQMSLILWMGGSHQDSTSILHPSPAWQDVQLWFQRPTHPGQALTLGQLTTAPSVSSPARHRTCASQYCARLPDQHARCKDSPSALGTDIAHADR